MANPNYIVKQFDTFPPMPAQLADSNGPINLEEAVSVTLFAKGLTTATEITGPCTMVNAVVGQIAYPWKTGDTNVVDQYSCEFSIHWNASQIQKVPNQQTMNPILQIDPDVTGAQE